MSKRFGRNQRRRARERIAELEGKVVGQTVTINRQAARITEFREHMEYVGATLGHMCVLSGETMKHIDGFDRMQLVPVQPLPDVIAGGFLDPDEQMCVEVMRLLEVEAVRKDAGRMIHAIVHLADKSAAYAMSETALRAMPPKALQHFIKRQVAPLLCACIAEQIGGKS